MKFTAHIWARKVLFTIGDDILNNAKFSPWTFTHLDVYVLIFCYCDEFFYLFLNKITNAISLIILLPIIAYECYSNLLVSFSWGVSSNPTKKQIPSKVSAQKLVDSKEQKIMRNLGLGFGNLRATAENIPPGLEAAKLPEPAEIFVKAASNCCGKLCGYCCCMCCIQACSRINDQCAIVLTQMCTALACFGCIECCAALCCSDSDGR